MQSITNGRGYRSACSSTKHYKVRAAALAVATILACGSAVAEEATDEDEGNRMVVIGSHIKRAADIGSLPVTSISAEDIEDLGVFSGDDLIKSIPQIGDVEFGGATGGGGVNDARGDVSSINLRGVGSGNTLTLLNGRRMVNHPGTQSENFVPVTTVNSNTLPVSGIRSLEVLRDGAAAIYGSDAVAGVINYVLDDDYTGTKIGISHGGSEGTPLDVTTFNIVHGFDFNDSRSHLTASFNYYNRNGMNNSERAYSASNNRSEFPGLPEAFIGDTQLDNRSTQTPWGEFNSSTLGTFHLQPDSDPGCEDSDGRGNPTTALGLAGVCVDRGSSTASSNNGRATRFDPASLRSLVSDVERLNFYAHMTHDFGEGLAFFGEAIYYSATAKRTREQSGVLTAQRFQISDTAAFNPFGEQVLLRRYRPIDTGTRNIEVDDTSYRILGGLQGEWGAWEWESAIFHTEAETNDLARNRIRTSAFQAAINNTDPTQAYNVFTGGDVNNPSVGDTTLNPQSVIDPFLVDVRRDSMTSLSQIDFKITNSALWSWGAGDIGVASGIEFRHESFEDDRDDLLDGSTPFIDQVSGALLSDSDVLGSSPTPDSKGNRDVTSLYLEFLVPLLDSDSQYAEVQLAARYENFSDVGDVIKPKVALFYQPADWVSLRASYAGGFRAPGLPQVTAEGVARSNTLTDPVTGTRQGVVDIRFGNTDLKPEDDVNISYGVVFTPTDDLTVTVDSWKIEQTNLVGLFRGQSQLLWDSYQRSIGSSNPLVERDPVTNEVIVINNPYKNLGERTIKGVDFSIAYDLETSFGDWDFTLMAAKLTKFFQEADEQSAILLAAQEAGDPSVPATITIAGVDDLIKQNGRPKLRGRMSIDWRKDKWGAGISRSYVSEITDTSTTATINEDTPEEEVITLPVASFATTNVYADYRFSNGFMEDSRLRLGVRNLTDSAPPLADEGSYGYFGKLHSNRGRYLYLSFSKKF